MLSGRDIGGTAVVICESCCDGGCPSCDGIKTVGDSFEGDADSGGREVIGGGNGNDERDIAD